MQEQAKTGLQSLARLPIPGQLLWVLCLVAVVLAGNWLQAQVHLNHDVSWIAHSAGWMLRGRVFGRDILDVTPPLAWWISLPAAALANSGWLQEPTAARLLFWVYLLIATSLFWLVVSQATPVDRRASTGWKTAFLLLAALAPGFSFGQREYVSVLFAMPYLAAAVGRASSALPPPRLLSCAIGMMAFVAFALKPYFLAVPLLVEAWLLLRSGWRACLRTETVVLAVLIAAYGAGVAILMPDYLASTIPLLKSVYWAYESPMLGFVVSRYVGVALPACFALLISLITLTWTRQHTVLLLAGVGYSVSYFVQNKGFVYHAYPVQVCAFCLLGVSCAVGVGRSWQDWRELRRPGQLIVVAISVALAALPVRQVHDETAKWYFTYNAAWGPVGRLRGAVIDTVNALAPTKGSYFFAFSTHPFPGFPTASYTTAEWSGRAASQFVIPAYARLDEARDEGLRRRILAAAAMQRSMVVEDFKRYPPSVVFSERARARLGLGARPFDDLAFYLEDPEFSAIWRSYREIAPVGPLRVYVKDKGP